MPTPPNPSTPRRRLAHAVALSVLALGACSAGGEHPSAGSLAEPADAAGAPTPEDPAPEDRASEDAAPDLSDGTAGLGDGSHAGGGVELAAATEGRQIVSTAEVELIAADADAVAREAADLATEVGGFLSGQETSRVGGTRTTLVLRVPAEEFGTVLDGLAGLADLTAQRVETDEVTEQVVDLESRITTAEASVVRLRALLDRSGTVAEVAQVEAELLARETTLETLRGQLRTIRQQVALATISVQIESEDAAPVVDEDDGLPSFLGGLTAGWDALLLTLAGAGALIGVVLPWLLLATLLGLPAWWVRRYRRRTSPTAAGAA